MIVTMYKAVMAGLGLLGREIKIIATLFPENMGSGDWKHNSVDHSLPFGFFNY